MVLEITTSGVRGSDQPFGEATPFLLRVCVIPVNHLLDLRDRQFIAVLLEVLNEESDSRSVCVLAFFALVHVLQQHTEYGDQFQLDLFLREQS